jgi:hypothetical protein
MASNEWGSVVDMQLPPAGEDQPATRPLDDDAEYNYFTMPLDGIQKFFVAISDLEVHVGPRIREESHARSCMSVDGRTAPLTQGHVVRILPPPTSCCFFLRTFFTLTACVAIPPGAPPSVFRC